MRPQRNLERHQRNQQGIDHPKILDRFNDTLKDHSILHATKGFRHFSVKRSKAALITAEMKQGKFPPAIISWQNIKRLLTTKEAV